MGRKNKYTEEAKLKAIKEYNKGIKSLSEICNELYYNKGMFLDWVNMFNEHGESIFNKKTFNNTYTKDFKEKVEKEYLNEN